VICVVDWGGEEGMKDGQGPTGVGRPGGGRGASEEAGCVGKWCEVAAGIELQDSVLVFDEAHNLLDAINSAHSTTITGVQ
jgi:hypothetical protein